MKVYVVTVCYGNGNCKVSQEGYTSLDAAQKFCRERSNEYGNSVKVNNYNYFLVYDDKRKFEKYVITEVNVDV